MNLIFQWIITRILRRHVHHCSQCGRIYYDRDRRLDEKAVCPECRKKM